MLHVAFDCNALSMLLHVNTLVRSSDRGQLLAEVRSIDLDEFPVEEVTLVGDEDPGFSHSSYVCFQVDRDCSDSHDYRYRCGTS